MAIPRGANLPAVTGIRFPAAALVMIGHAADFGADSINAYIWWDAVPFFFLLSGFVLAHVYPSLDDWSARKHFLLARFARIYPLHLLTFLMVVLALPADARTPLEKCTYVLKNLTLIHSWSSNHDVNFAFNGPSWSISVEFFLYASFPLLLFGWRRTWWFWLIATYLVVINADQLMPRAADSATVPLRYVFLFALGIATASFYRWLHPRVRYGRLVGTILEVTAGAFLYYRYQFLNSHFNYVLCPALAYASVVLVMALGRGWISQAFAWRPIVVLGEASFALYMLHQIVLRWMLVHELHTNWSAGVFLTTYVGVSLAGSYGLWRYVECPARRLIMARFGQRRHTPASQEALPAIDGSSPVSLNKPHFVPSVEQTGQTSNSMHA